MLASWPRVRMVAAISYGCIGRSVRHASTARASGLPRRRAIRTPWVRILVTEYTGTGAGTTPTGRRVTPVDWSSRTTGHAPVRHLTWGCVASISTVEVGEASRRRRNVVKEPATCRNANTNEGNLALAA